MKKHEPTDEALDSLLARGVALAKERRSLRIEQLEHVQGGMAALKPGDPGGPLDGFVKREPEPKLLA